MAKDNGEALPAIKDWKNPVEAQVRGAGGHRSTTSLFRAFELSTFNLQLKSST
jgi:hypothetical protein